MMPLNALQAESRADEVAQFLNAAGWRDALLTPLAGDASFRRYIRVNSGNRKAMLMDAPPDKEDVRPFIRICSHLHEYGYSSPECYAQDVEKGFLLLEDLGDDLFTTLLTRPDPTLEKILYEAAIDVLVDWHDNQALQRHASALNIPLYDHALLMRELSLFSDWYLPKVSPAMKEKLSKEYLDIWSEILESYPVDTSLFVHRDYHANNLLWLKEREGVKKVGLLDFQDGVWGSPAYDLVSLLEDARRDVSPELADTMFARYAKATGVNKKELELHYAVLGAQRNCKILGIFVRLWARDGKPHYLPHLPRVWNYLDRDLQHPALARLKAWFDVVAQSSWRHIKP